jgi:ketosteroid isomerase-like protein
VYDSIALLHRLKIRMKIPIIRTATVLTTAVIGFGLFYLWTNYGANSASRREILKLTNDFEAASAKKDIATLDRITADDLTITRVDGSVINKAEYEEIIRNFDFIVDSFEVNNVQVDVEGDQATVTGGLEMLAHLEGRKPISHSSTFTYLFKKQQAAWQIACVRMHSNFTQ